jgi:DNA-binding MarR family transcriptional regulator
MSRTQDPAPEVRRAIASLQRLAELFAERRRALAREAGLSEAQWQVLEEVAGEGFMPSLFARRREVSAAAVSRTLRQLLARDLVRVAIDAEDGRQRRYRLSARGRRTLERLEHSRERAIEAIWRGLPAEDLRGFERFAGELAERLERYLEQG